MCSLVYLPFILFSAVAVIWVVVPVVIEVQVRRGKAVARPARPRPRLVLIQGGGRPPERELPETRIA